MRVLLTGGRAPATLELARLFHDDGWEVHVAESLPVHLAQHSRAVTRSWRVPPPAQEPEAFTAALAAIGADLLIPTCEEVFWVARDLEQLRGCNPLTDSLDKLRQLHDKHAFMALLATLGHPAPATTLLTGQGALDDLWSEREALVFKPVFSRFGAHTFVSPRDRDRARILVSPERPWVAQARLEGRQVCSYAVCRAGRVVAHTSYSADFRAGVGSSIYFQHEDQPSALALAETVAAHLDYTGQLAFDFIETDNGLLPIECNPRATSGVHLFARGDGLCAAIHGDERALVTPSGDRAAMIGLGMLTYGLKRGLADGWRAFRRGHDVVFRWDDLAPFVIDQPAVVIALCWRALFSGVGFLEASTLDIEWNG